MTSSKGILLVNVGTPDSSKVSDVRKYLRQFLMDPRVINIPFLFRWFLVHLIIAPIRGPKSAHAYQQIWTKEGSPLKLYSEKLAQKLQEKLKGDKVLIGMRYQNPSIASALTQFSNLGITEVTMLPMFPQYSIAATETAVVEAKRVIAQNDLKLNLKVLGDFYEDAGFIEAQAEIVADKMKTFNADHLLMSYHGLPENHVQATDLSKSHCLKVKDCCSAINQHNKKCYRAQSFATSRALASKLGLSKEQYSVSFQSRLGRTPWIQPFTDVIIADLKARGVRKLMVVCPSFVADCLETLEEIGMRCRADWLALGGEDFCFVPCVNASDKFVDAVTNMIQK